jgi:hypothetical protein
MLANDKEQVQFLQAAVFAERGELTGETKQRQILLDTVLRRVVAVSRMLHVHPEATQGKSRQQPGKLDKQREAEAAMDAAGHYAHLIPGLRAVK